MSTPQHPSNIVQLPKPEQTGYTVERHGMGYRGLFEERWLLRLGHIHASRDDVSGLLDVTTNGASLFYGRFNVASLTTRNTLAKHLQQRTEYPGWLSVIETFCRHVLWLHNEGPKSQSIGDQPTALSISWVLEPLIPEGTPATIYGPPAQGKSYLAAAVAVSVQLGIPVVKGWLPHQRNVLILDWESTRQSWNDRVIRLANGLNLSAPPVLRYRSCRGRGRLCDLVEPIAQQVQQDDIGLVVVDSAGFAEGSRREGADANDGTQRMFEAIEALGTTVLVIDQVNKAGEAYGSVFKQYNTRSLWRLEGETDPPQPQARQFVLRDEKFTEGGKRQPIGLRMVFGDDATMLEQCEITSHELGNRVLSLPAKMRRLLLEAGRPLTRQELVRELDVDRAKLRTALHDNKNQFITLDRDRVGLLQPSGGVG